MRVYLFVIFFLSYAIQLVAAEVTLTPEKIEKFRALVKQYEEELKQDPTNLRLSLALGDAYYSIKEYPKAIQFYKAALGLAPDHNDIKILLANSYLANLEKAPSEKLYQEVLNSDSKNIDALLGLGRIQALEYDFKKAKKYYEKANQLDPRNLTLLYYSADLDIDLKKYGEAEKTLEILQKNNPKAKWISSALIRAKEGPILEKGLKMEDQGDYKSAMQLYQEQIEKNPNSIDPYLSLARVYTLSKQPQEAVNLLNAAINIDPASSALNLALAQANMANGHIVKAKFYFEQALAKSFNSADALSGLGRAFAIMGDNETAEKYFKIALKEHPESIVALSSYAEWMRTQKMNEEALKIYDTILKKDPDAKWAKRASADIKFNKLLADLEQSQSKQETTKSMNSLKKIMSQFPDVSAYYIQLGKFYVQKKQYQNAINLYLAGIKAFPHSEDLSIALGSVYLKRGDLVPAKQIFDEVLEKNSKNSEAISGLGRLAELQGRQSDALELYRRALKVNPYDLTALNYLADLFLKEKNYDEARLVLEKIKRIDPTALWVDETITDLKYGSLLDSIKEEIAKKNDKKVGILFEQLLNEAPKNPKYFLQAALYYHHEKKYEEAIETYLRGIKIAPKNSALYSGIGFSYISNRHFKEARAAFTKALELDPKNPDALAGMASLAVFDKNFIEANKYIQSALLLGPRYDAVLSTLGNLRMAEKRYKDAAHAYLQLIQVKPNEKWIQQLYENALNGEELDKIEKLIQDKQFSKAASSYALLMKKYPSNPLYSSGLGLMYLRLKEYAEARDVYLEALKANPEELELLISLGYSYLLAKDFESAKPILEESVKRDPKNAEALAGLGRVYAEEDRISESEMLYQKALQIRPDNESALNFYALLLMKQKRFTEAEGIIEQLLALLPNEEWVQRFLKDAQDGPMIDAARQFANNEEFEAALVLYQQLVDLSPSDPARYEPLGQMYVNLEDYWSAICVYQMGLELDSDAIYLSRSMAYAYIYLEEYDAALEIFYSILDQHPEDAESFGGLGRVEALTGSFELAEQLYLYALSLAPKNTTILGFYADLKRVQGYFCEALYNYGEIQEIYEEDGVPKWVNTSIQDMLNKTMPTVTLLGGTHQEKEWDHSAHRNSAKYQVQGYGALINYPFCCDLTIWGKMYDEYYQLKDLLTNKIIYSFDAERAHLGCRWLINQNWFMDVQAGLTNYSRYRRGTSDAHQDTLFEPGIRFTYQKPQEKASIGFWSESNIVARNFTNNTSKLVGRYYLNGTYEKQVMQRGWMGFDASLSAYNDYVDNTSAYALGWFQWRPPVYTNNIVFRYHLRYGCFSKNIPDYYTYYSQWVNYFQVTFEKYWRVCFADSLYSSIAFGHGFQNTLTKFAQFIVLNPTLNNKLEWDNRQYNIVQLKGVYKRDQLQASLILDYYHDTEKYQMASVLGELTWRF